MKLISIGSIDQKYKAYFILYFLFGLSVEGFLSVIRVFQNNDKTNIPLKIIIRYTFCIFFIIPEIIYKKSKSYKKIEFHGNEKDDNEIVYIYRKPQREITIKNLIILILLGILEYIYLFAGNSYEIKSETHFKLFFIEGYKSLDILYLLLIYKFSYKIIFYRHQYLSLIIMIIMGFIRYLIKIIYLKKDEFEFPKDLFCLIPILIFPFIESLYYYVIRIFMKYKFFSPCLITFFQGSINTFIALIMLIISLYVDFEETFFKSLLDKINVPNAYVVIFSILISIFNGSLLYLEHKTLYGFSVFYLIFFLYCSDIINIIKDISIDKLFGWIM